MRIAIFHASRFQAGLGHLVRSKAFASAAKQAGHEVAIFSSPPLGEPKPAWIEAIRSADWVVADYPGAPPPWIRAEARRLCLLNGVGHPLQGDGDLIIVQGIWPWGNVPEGVFAGVEYVILRPQIFQMVTRDLGYWLVWGGHLDPLRLHRQFAKAMGGAFAVHLRSPEGFARGVPLGNLVAKTGGILALPWLACCRKGLVHMGMTAWELIALGKPAYICAATDLHLEFARAMEDRGLCTTYPRVGKVHVTELRAFLLQEFRPQFTEVPDPHGAQRILRLMQEGGP